MGGDQARSDTQRGPVAVRPPYSRIEAALTQTLTREGVEAYFAVISKIRRLAENVVEDVNGRLPMLDTIRGCPTCFQLDGFHENAPHAVARAAIPARLTWKPGDVPAYRRGR